MKKYRSHKVVEAAKIIDLHPGDQVLELQNAQATPSQDWWKRYTNAGRSWVGGYYVRYEDGYDSWSPAEVFEEGYTEV